MAATCTTVLTLPSGLAGITTPCCPAATRRPLTANSRAMITIAAHGATRSSDTSVISAAAISSLSAIGSMTFPNVVIERRDRAMYPSRPSVMAAAAKTMAATTEPLGVASSSATTSTGTSRMRKSVRTFGTFSGNIVRSVPGSALLSNKDLEADQGAERPRRRHRRGQQRPWEDPLDPAPEHEQGQRDPAEPVDPAEH